jgi:hypothetical protein
MTPPPVASVAVALTLAVRAAASVASVRTQGSTIVTSDGAASRVTLSHSPVFRSGVGWIQSQPWVNCIIAAFRAT